MMSVDVFEELCSFVSIGPRFHGSSGETAAAEYLVQRLDSLGLSAQRQEVHTIAWCTSGAPTLAVEAPVGCSIECWPMLWSESTTGSVQGLLVPLGKQGLWRNAMVWEKFAVVDNETVVSYISARDAGPACPQPIPAGSDSTRAHLAIGHADGAMLSDWFDEGRDVAVTVSVDTERGARATGSNLYVDIPGLDQKLGRVVVCAHYDSFWNTPGAYDNASGTIALLELARYWVQAPARHPVRLVFFAAEEWHLAGSRQYVSAMSDGDRDRTEFVLNIDGLGRGNFLEFSVGPESFEYSVTRSIRAFAESSGREGLRLASRFPPLVGTDDASFYAAGIPSVHLTFNDLDLLHRPSDLPNRGSAANIEWCVLLVQHLIDRLDNPERPLPLDLL